MKSLRLIAIAAALSATAGAAFADSAVIKDGYAFQQNPFIPSGARLEIGTTGYGGALLWDVNPYLGLSLGYNGGDISWSDDLKIDGSTYDMDMDNKLAYLNAEIRPWGESTGRWASTFYVAAGVGYVDTDYTLNRSLSNSNDTLKIDGTNFYAPSGQGSVNGKLDYTNKIAPYVGLGVAPKINKNWSVFGEAGTYYTGNPNADLNAYGLEKVGDPSVNGQVAADNEAYKIENKDRYKWLPVAKLGVSYHW